MMDYLNTYISKLEERGHSALAESVGATASRISERYIKNFSFRENVSAMLYGEVQSGKTSHMFGIACESANNGFGIFVLLTSDISVLHTQTYERALRDLTDFCVCNEDEYLKFRENGMRTPAMIVLKKNASVLKKWKANFSSTDFCKGNPMFVLDDEADSASLNTKVNIEQQSRINSLLEDIKSLASSSVYLQVTATPQAVLLQTAKSGFRPFFVCYFRPGPGYIGGDFFFGDDSSPYIVLTKDDEAESLVVDDEFPENGLKEALVNHLLVSADTFLSGGRVCNFLIHPSSRTELHSHFAEKIGRYLNEIIPAVIDEEACDLFKYAYEKLKSTKPQIIAFPKAMNFIRKMVERDSVSILVLNSVNEFIDRKCFEEGINIIVGGNTLGRGMTIPKLQTIYYCRTSKKPLADTMWQHTRMFGYDREPAMMRIYLPPNLFKLFREIYSTNKGIVACIEKGIDVSEIILSYPRNLNPTRKNVLDAKSVDIISGGVNYFPFSPENPSIEEMDRELERFADGEYSASLKFLTALLEGVVADDGWDKEKFIGVLEALQAENSLAQGFLIVRRNRDIAKGTGTLLSPNDRAIGEQIWDRVVLTMYKVTGNKGWNGRQIWIPNIKLPGNRLYFSVSETG